MAQYMSLAAPARGFDAAERDANTEASLRRLGPEFLEAADLDTVVSALALYSNIAQVVRLCIDGPFDPDDAPEGLKELLCRTTDLPDIGVLEAELKRSSSAVRAIFRRLLG